MLRGSLIMLVVLGAAAALAAVALGRPAAVQTLVGTDGPGFKISLTSGGKAVKTLKAGTYRLVLHDKAAIHGWSLDGPHGFAKDIAAVPFVGTKTVTLKLKPGGYKFYCPAHEPTMFGRFTVR